MTEGEKADSFLRQTQDRRFARNDRKEGYGEDRGGMLRVDGRGTNVCWSLFTCATCLSG